MKYSYLLPVTGDSDKIDQLCCFKIWSTEHLGKNGLTEDIFLMCHMNKVRVPDVFN